MKTKVLKRLTGRAQRLRGSCALLLAGIVVSPVALSQTADVVFLNGNLWTVDSLLPRAQGLAVAGDRILLVGSEEQIRATIGSNTTMVDLDGKFVVPGFIDNHAHFISGGFQLQSVDLRHARDEIEFTRIIRERAERHPGRWITGGDWDHDGWPGAALPTRELIDRFTPSTPVFVSRYDGHMGLANSRVLEMAGITRETPDPSGGHIVKDPSTGEPTGILKDAAMSKVWSLIPPPTEEEMLDAAGLALAEARSVGLTSIQDISAAEHIATYQKLKEQGALTARLYCRLPLRRWKELADRTVRAATGDEWIRVGSLKAFVDGSLGSSTALFFEPYLSDPSTRGLPSDVLAGGDLERWAMAADSAGLQLSIHAIGDSANSLLLDLFERIVQRNPQWDRRLRIEHAQHIDPRDFERFARLGVIASVQPYHAIDDGRWAETRIGPERCKTTYPFKSFLDHGVRMCFGSDWTVAPLDPLLGLYAAVTRRTTDGKHPNGWVPDQRILIEQAIRAYTLESAYAAYEEDDKGSLSKGKFADFVVLSHNLLEIDSAEILDVRVEMTVVGGRTVYRRP
jgi:predicted amidohydrolase YtcJ